MRDSRSFTSLWSNRPLGEQDLITITAEDIRGSSLFAARTLVIEMADETRGHPIECYDRLPAFPTRKRPCAPLPTTGTAEGVTLFTTEVHPTDDDCDLGELKEMVAWRDGHR